MLQLKTAVAQEQTRIVVTFDGPVVVSRIKAKPPEKGGGYYVTLQGMGYSVSASSALEIPLGTFLGARCVGRVSKDNFGNTAYSITDLLALRDGDGAWQEITLGSGEASSATSAKRQGAGAGRP